MKTQSESKTSSAILQAAKAIDSGEQDYSCHALVKAFLRAYPMCSPFRLQEIIDEYEKLFQPGKSRSFCDDLYKEYSDAESMKQWRVLALCLFAAMKNP